ncbi:MAG: winged helix-turn-helix transcriptional regulator [Ilumatobacter sp.]|nr:winged helix-turn-helix transcriptional regulator [Ilumatobacter sp.]
MDASAALLDHPPNERLDAVTSALADGTRRGLLRLVRADELSAGELAANFPHISRPAVSQHLRVLHEAGLVRVRPVGNRRMYRADIEALGPVSRFIEEMWSDRLQRLKQAAEAAERGRS